MNNAERKCGNYALVDRIAKGGMAEVYLARTTGAFGVDRLVAVKMLLPMRAERKQTVAMFIDEARLAVELSHPNIVQIFELGVSEGGYYIAMEYVPGFDLTALLRRLRANGERMPIAPAVFIAWSVCAALDYAHRRVDSQGKPLNIVHRDISPQNVLIGDEGSVKVADFGIALSNMRLTKTVGIKLKGKVYYMSPEQAWGRDLDARSDLFSAGTLLYEMLTGQVPFDGQTDFDVIYAVRDCTVIPPRELRPEIPEELEAIVLRAMAQDRDHRFADAESMHGALEPLLLAGGRPFGARQLAEYLAELCGEQLDERRRRLAELLTGHETEPATTTEAARADWSQFDVTQIVEMDTKESAVLAVHQPWAAEVGLHPYEDTDENRAQREQLDRITQMLRAFVPGDLPDDLPDMTSSELDELRDIVTSDEIALDAGDEISTQELEDWARRGGEDVRVFTSHSPLERPVPSPVDTSSEPWAIQQHIAWARVGGGYRRRPHLGWVAAGFAASAAVMLAVVVSFSFSDRRTNRPSVAEPAPAWSPERSMVGVSEESATTPAATRDDVMRLRRALGSRMRDRGLNRGDSEELDALLDQLVHAVRDEDWVAAAESAEAATDVAEGLEVSAGMVRRKLVRMARRAARIEDADQRARLENTIAEGYLLLDEGEVEPANRLVFTAILAVHAAARSAAAAGSARR